MRRCLWALALVAACQSAARLDAVGPRVISNATSQPLAIYGEGFAAGMQLVLELEPPLSLPTVVLDGRQLAARLPAAPLPADVHSLRVGAHLIDARGGRIAGDSFVKIVNDTGFPVPYDLVVTREGVAFIASPNTDELWVVPRAGDPYRVPTCDGPRALALWQQTVVVACEHAEALYLHRTADPRAAPAEIAVGRGAQDVAVDGDRAYVTSRLNDAVAVVALREGALVQTLEAGVNPGPIAVGSGYVVAGNPSAGDLSIIELTGGTVTRSVPTPATSILGGHTEPLQQYVVGGKAARAVVISGKHAFVASIGPNIGPNPERMEVSMNGGVGVVELESGRFVRHVSDGKGVIQALAIDASGRTLYGADLATGRVVVYSVERLIAADDATARLAVLGAAALDPPEGTTLVRPRGDFGIGTRSGISLHTGPWALAVSGGSLFVLARFSGALIELGIGTLSGSVVATKNERRLFALGSQPLRRMGEIVYFTDLGGSRMTCDTCHREGHDEGILFTKTEPMHFYRSPSLRGISETPPYFTPSKLPSLATTAQVVLGRNRYHNPDPTKAEVQAVAVFQDCVAPPPNPYAGKDGAPADVVDLPDGRRGVVARGRALFRERCAACHPPPQFTTDQDKQTRARFHDVGTPITLPIRPSMQDTALYPVPVPALVGVWDNFPLLHSGAAGFDVGPGDQLVPRPFALRRVFEIADPEKHGSRGLEAQPLDDLLAYLLTL